ncbi:MAG: PTS transporter subunit EIIC [Eubacteriales bacterium]
MNNSMTAEKPKRDSRLFGILQRVGRSFMLPIALLPIAGLLLGIGSSLTNTAMISAYHLEKILGPGTVANSVLTVLSDVGSIIFANLPILFAMGVALGMAENEKATATLAAAISFFVMHETIHALLTITGKIENNSLPEGSIADVVGIKSLEMGVFGGIIVGLGVAALHNRFYKIRLPGVISFFGGTRFVPIISTVVYTAVGVLMFFLWPYIQTAIYALGGLVRSSGYVGTLVYGFIERILIPFGLHHVFYLPFWQTGLGGSAVIDGNLVAGAQNIFFAELASPATEVFSVEATRFMSGKFPLMIFGLPGMALAMYRCARPEKRRAAGGLLLSAALTAALTGITEPLEFTFLFVAPSMYFIHSMLAGVSYMLMHLLKVGVGMTFSGGIIDFLLFGVLQGQKKTNWIMIPIVGIVYFAVYYLLFGFMIRKFNFATPGRETDGSEVKLYTRADYDDRKKRRRTSDETVPPSEPALSDADVGLESTSSLILRGLGGRENIENIDACATRLRVTVKNPGLVTDALLKKSGAAGVIRRGDGIQVVYGPQVSVIKSELEEHIDRLEAQD